MTEHPPAIAIIGVGPRGLSTLERLIAQLKAASAPPATLRIHLIDPAQPGGKIWDPAQPKVLCMNTFAHGMTLFAEPGATVSAPVLEGPTIHEWVRAALGFEGELDAPKRRFLLRHPAGDAVFNRFERPELESIQPHSYLPRALYGYYLQWYYQALLDEAPDFVEVRHHRAAATELLRAGGRDLIILDNGEQLLADATIAVTGWQRQGKNKQEQWIAAQIAKNPQLRWIPADSPIDQGVERLEAGERVLVRGLGMGLFDVLSLCTEHRGGTYLPDPTAPGELRYEPSGEEPRFFISSHRGYPYLPQSDDRGLPQPAPIPRLKEVVARLSSRKAARSIDYDVEVWPAVLKDSYQAYVDTLARVSPEALLIPHEEIVAAIDATPVDAAGAFYGIDALDEVITASTTTEFSLLKWIHLIPERFESVEKLSDYLAARTAEDLAEAELGPDSPVRAALWSLGWSRKPTQVLGAEGRYTVESRHNTFDLAIGLGQMACSGPPIFRTRQLLALVRAGIVRFVGGAPLLDTDRDTGEWTMSSSHSSNERVRATTLLDAWVNKPDVRRRPVDPFSASLLDSGRLVAFKEESESGEWLPTASPWQDPHTRRARGIEGTADPSLHLVGIPAHAQFPDTTISPPIPGTDSWFIQETDRAAASAARIALGCRVPA